MLDDTVFKALAHRQRRQLLANLRTDDPQRIRRLSGASRELSQATDSFLEEFLRSSREMEGVNKALVRTHHVHLPELVEFEFIEWDRDSGVVRQGPRFNELKPVLALVDERSEAAVQEKVVVR